MSVSVRRGHQHCHQHSPPATTTTKGLPGSATTAHPPPPTRQLLPHHCTPGCHAALTTSLSALILMFPSLTMYQHKSMFLKIVIVSYSNRPRTLVKLVAAIVIFSHHLLQSIYTKAVWTGFITSKSTSTTNSR